MRQTSRLQTLILALAAVALVLSSWGGPPVARAAEPLKFAFGALPIGAFPVQVMKEKGLEKKYDFDIKVTVYPTVQGFYAGAQAKAFQVGILGWASVCAFDYHGGDWVNVYSGIYTTDQILVRPGSPLKTFADLKGKKVGLFGGPNSQTAINFRIIGLTRFGFDPAQEMKLVYGAPALTAGLLQKGEIDAAVLLEPFVTKLLIPGKVRILAGIDNLYREKTGDHLMQLSIGVLGDFARRHPEGLRRFIKVYEETARQVRTDPALGKEMARQFLGARFAEKLTDSQIRGFVERTATYQQQWDAGYVKRLKELAKKGIALAGSEFLPAVPDKAFSLAYVPGR